jgi:copper chaperone NosL
MVVSDPRLGGQLVTRGEEPLFFDDIGCLRDYRKAHPEVRAASAFVADHRTGKWVPAERAVYVRTTKLWTPMGSQLIAYADAASRDADPASSGGAAVTATEAMEGSR